MAVWRWEDMEGSTGSNCFLSAVRYACTNTSCLHQMGEERTLRNGVTHNFPQVSSLLKTVSLDHRQSVSCEHIFYCLNIFCHGDLINYCLILFRSGHRGGSRPQSFQSKMTTEERTYQKVKGDYPSYLRRLSRWKANPLSIYYKTKTLMHPWNFAAWSTQRHTRIEIRGALRTK